MAQGARLKAKDIIILIICPAPWTLSLCRSGKKYRIGTDEPEPLTAAIRDNLRNEPYATVKSDPTVY